MRSGDRWAVESGRAVMQLVAERLCGPRDIVTMKALENAAVCVGATGGSTERRAAFAGDGA